MRPPYAGPARASNRSGSPMQAPKEIMDGIVRGSAARPVDPGTWHGRSLRGGPPGRGADPEVEDSRVEEPSGVPGAGSRPCTPNARECRSYRAGAVVEIPSGLSWLRSIPHAAGIDRAGGRRHDVLRRAGPGSTPVDPIDRRTGAPEWHERRDDAAALCSRARSDHDMRTTCTVARDWIAVTSGCTRARQRVGLAARRRASPARASEVAGEALRGAPR